MRMLVAVAEAGSLTEAAKRLGVSQPGASRQIQRLEAEMGVPLLERAPAGVRLTPDGERTLEFARKTLRDYDALRATSGAEPLHGHLRIAASTTPGEYLVPQLASKFIGLHPRVATEIFVGDSATVRSELIERRWDVGFVGQALSQRGVVQAAVARDEVVLAVPGDHRFAGRDEVGLDELQDERIITREDGSGTQATVHETLRNRGLRLPRHSAAMALGSSHGIVAAVDSGLGIGFVSRRALSGHDRSRVAAVRLAETSIVRNLYLIYESKRVSPRHVRAFIDFVIASAASQDSSPVTGGE